MRRDLGIDRNLGVKSRTCNCSSNPPTQPMPDPTWTAVDRYLTDLFVPPDAALDAALEASAAASLPDIQVSPIQGKLSQEQGGF